MSTPKAWQIASIVFPKISTAQLAVLKAWDGVPLTSEELSVFRHLTQTTIAKPRGEAYRELFVEGGRRSGKDTHLAAPIAVAEALADHSAITLAPGESLRIPVFGPYVEHTGTFLDACAGILTAIEEPFEAKQGALRLTNRNVVIEAKVADHLGGRSRTSCLIVVTEGAFLPTDEGADGYDVEVYAAARASGATTKARLVSISSPWTKRGVHYDTVRRTIGKTRGDVLSIHGASWVFNPTVTAESTRKREPDERRWRREYLAEPSDSEENFVRAADVRRAVSRGVREREPRPGVTYFAGLDVGLRRDSTALVICHREIQKRENGAPLDKIVVDAVRVWRPDEGRLDPMIVMSEAVATCRRYRCENRIARDNFAGDFVEAALRYRSAKSVEVSMSVPAQAARFGVLAQRFLTHMIELVDDADLVRELEQLRLKRRDAGRVAIEAPAKRGAHDDIADALAIAVEQAASHPPTAGQIYKITKVRFDPMSDERFAADSHWVEEVVVNGEVTVRPTIPPIGSEDYYDAVERARRAGISFPGMPEWEGRPVDPRERRALPEDDVRPAWIEPPRPAGVLAMQSRRLPAMGEGGRGGQSFGFEGAKAPPGDGRKGRM